MIEGQALPAAGQSLATPPEPPSLAGGNGRGGSQPPHTASQAEPDPCAARDSLGDTIGRPATTSRVLTLRIEPDDATWKLLRKRAQEAANYRNKWAQAHLAQALKWTPPEDAPKDSLTKLVRADARGDLSSAVYSACETEVKKDWERAKKRIMAGAPLPQYRTADSLAFATITGRPGVRIVEQSDDGYVAEMMANANSVEGGCWITAPISRRTKKDEFRLPMLRRFASGELDIKAARVIFKLRSGKTLLQLTYAIEVPKVPMGERHATLAQLGDGRVLLRCGEQRIDYTSRVHHLVEMAAKDDEIRRRWYAQIGWRRGSARLKRIKNLRMRPDDRRRTYLHQWSHAMVDWIVGQGAGTMSFAEVVGGSWPAAELKEMLKYKCEERGIEMVEPTFDQPETEKAAKATLRRRAHKARKTAQAVRQISTTLGG